MLVVKVESLRKIMVAMNKIIMTKMIDNSNNR